MFDTFTPSLLILLSFFIALVLGRVVSRYYPHDGLYVLGGFLAFTLSSLLLFFHNSVEYNSIYFLIGLSAGFIFLPLSMHFSIFKAITFFTLFICSLLGLHLFLNINQLASFIILGLLTFLIIRYKQIPYYLLVFLWVLGEWSIRLRYKIIYEGVENLASNDGLLLVSNHLSWLDWLLLQFPIKRRVRYLINKGMYYKQPLHPFIKLQGCIPISRHAFKGGVRQAQNLLHNKQVVGVFPEGSISRTGVLGNFYSGFEYIKAKEGHIIPVYLEGLWGSKLSRSPEKFCDEKSGWRRVLRISYGSSMPLSSDAQQVKEAIKQLQQSSIRKHHG